MRRTDLARWWHTAAALLLAPALCRAQENLELGKMWTFENPPLAYLQQEYGFTPTAEWLAQLRLASLRFGEGCSASFVSPRGLIMTNHHCVEGYVAQVSPEETDWVKTGFYAKSHGDEVRVPGLTVQQLVGQRDVTAAIEQGITAQMSDAEKAAARDENRTRVLEQAREQQPGLEPEIVKLHSGAVWQLYSYKVWDDVRLVCAPQVAAAFFGGDYDNFCYPRWCTDFAFCRAYEDGKPADTSAHWFKFRTAGPTDGELVFVTGNPGSTDRLLTKAQLEYHRDAELPLTIEFLQTQLDVLRPAAESSPDLARLLRSDIFQLENSAKALRGELAGLHDAGLMEQKTRAEQAFRARIAREPKLQAEFGGLWDRLAEISAEQTKLAPSLRYHAPGPSPELSYAVILVRGARPDVPAEEQKAIERALATFEFERQPLYDKLFLLQLASARRWLGHDDPFVRVLLGERSPEEAAALLHKSKVHDPEFVRELRQAGAQALAQSEDVAIAAARILVEIGERNRARSEALAAEEEQLRVQIGRALFAAYGEQVSPDATFTLRFSDGRVMGYPYNGTLAPWRTSFHGMFARSLEFDGKEPWQLPAVWHERKDRIDLTAALNFVSTNDIIGGNSGSPVVNRDLEAVGLIFDGNVESLPNRFLWRQGSGRSVSVHPQGIIQTLRHVLDAGALADELERVTTAK